MIRLCKAGDSGRQESCGGTQSLDFVRAGLRPPFYTRGQEGCGILRIVGNKKSTCGSKCFLCVTGVRGRFAVG